MACLVYSRTGLENSPYASLLDPVHWLDICDIFARDSCALLGLSLESPLQVCITAGCVALPSLLQIRQVMHQRQVTGVWTSKDELPVSEFLTQISLFLRRSYLYSDTVLDSGVISWYFTPINISQFSCFGFNIILNKASS